mgnify:CR=1 FL=1
MARREIRARPGRFGWLVVAVTVAVWVAVAVTVEVAGQKTSFGVSDKLTAVGDAGKYTLTIKIGDDAVKTFPASYGKPTHKTPNGTFSVLERNREMVMDSSTYGLPINSRLGYKQTINYATRISTDGIYLHQLDSSVWAQGNTNTSHGCLNLNGDNARWFFDFSVPGDIVEIRNTGGAPLEQWQNGDWSVPWQQWTKASALASSEGR